MSFKCPFARYEMSNCLLEATLQKIESDCKCTPKFFMTFVTGFEPCEGQQKKCMNVHMADMGEQRSITDRGILKVDIYCYFMGTQGTNKDKTFVKGFTRLTCLINY